MMKMNKFAALCAGLVIAGSTLAYAIDAELFVNSTTGPVPVQVDPNNIPYVNTQTIGTYTINSYGTTSITTGGTSQTLSASNVRGCFILNPLTAAGQQIGTAESLFIGVGIAATTTVGGKIIEIQPGGTFTCPPGGSGSYYITAVTTGHKYAGYYY